MAGLLALLLLGPSSAPAAATYPFPQNKAQPTTAYYPAYLNSDVQAVYNAWLTDQVTSVGAGGYRRVRRHGDPTLQADSTVSEGIGYGMIIAVYMNDQALFDDFWRYYNLHLDGNGLMNWYISADGATTLGGGGASDADQDAAWALCMASYQWGTSTYGPTYLSLAQGLITKLYNVYVDPTTKAISPWGGAGDNFNISYFDPAEYRVFAQISGNNGWLAVVDACYTGLFNSLKAANGNQSNGLVPAWSNYAGTPVPGFAGAPIHFQYDSCRTPFRIGKDWYFFGEPRAKQYLDKINSFYVPLGADHITDGYDLNGAPRPQYDASGTGANGQSAAFVAPAMQAAMCTTANSAFVQKAYDDLKTNTLLIGGPYYDQCWTVMGMLWASGNYLNYVPTPTPTPTVDACQVRIKVNAAGGAQSGFSADQAYSAGGWGYVPAYAGGLGTSAGPVTGDPNPGLYLTERYDSSGSGEIRYSFTLPNGPASVTLHWAETYFSSAGQRRMNVFIGGTQVETNLDIYAAAGGQNKALSRTYATTVSGGVLTIRFVTVNANATIHAIEVSSGSLCTPTSSPTRTPFYTATASPSRTPSFTASPSFSVSPTPTPSATPYPTPDACSLALRVNCGGTAFTGAGGLVWAADKAYSAGSYGYVSWAAGTAGTSTGPYVGTTDDALFQAERWGNPVAYRFDVPNGPYQVRVRLAESYFDTANNRSVAVTANGVSELNADLFTWAGGKFTAKDLSFIVSVSSGSLVLQCSSSNNNGTFMAIEVLGLNGCSPTPTPVFSATQSPSRTPTRTRTPSASPSASPTLTLSPSASPSATPSSSPSPLPASPSATPTLTLSGSPSATRTLTPLASLTGTPTFTALNSPSQSPSASASPSRTPASTATSSPNASPSASPSATPSSTASRTPAATATPSGTRSPSPSVSPTLTDVPPGSSPTATPTRSPSHSPSPSVSPTASASPSATPSVSDSPTASPSASPSPTPSRTVSPTLTETLSVSPSPTPALGTPTATRTASPTMTPSQTPSATSTRTQTPTLTPSATRSATPSMPASPTATATPTAPVPFTATPSATATATPGGPTDTPAATATTDGGELIITELKAWPQPMRAQGGWVSAFVKGPSERLRLRLYTPAMVLVGEIQGPGSQGGWTRLSLDANAWQGLGSGLYYYTVVAEEGGRRSPAMKPGRILLLR